MHLMVALLSFLVYPFCAAPNHACAADDNSSVPIEDAAVPIIYHQCVLG